MPYTGVLGTTLTLPVTGLALAGQLNLATALAVAGGALVLLAARWRRRFDARAAGLTNR